LKNICIIGPFPPPIGGDARALQTLTESSVIKKNFKIYKVNLSDGRLRTSEKRIVTFSKILTILKAVKNISSVSKKIDIFYLTISQSFFGSIRDISILRTIYNKKRKDAKVIIHLHGGGFRNFYNNTNKVLKKLIKKFYSKVDKAIVLSNSLCKMFENIITEDKIYVVENCVDHSCFINSMIIKNKIENINLKKDINVIYLSNMIYTKGYFDVLKSADIISKHVNYKFYFAGAFPTIDAKKEFDDYIKLKGLTDNVRYLGIVDGDIKKELLIKGDIFVLPTYFPPEGQPISILEAMGAAMPIITTKHGGIPDIIKDGINGFYVMKKDPQSIANAIEKLVKDRELFKKIALQNRSEVENKYLEKHYIDKMLQVFCN